MNCDKNREQAKFLDGRANEGIEKNGNCTSYCFSHKTEELNNSLLELNLNSDAQSDDEPHTAPVEILSEFLSTLMSRDYRSALHYCKLILQYEPDNKIVQDFYPLIQEKINLVVDYESDEFADNEGSSYSSKSENSTEYFSSTSAGTENVSFCSSISSEEEETSVEHSTE